MLGKLIGFFLALRLQGHDEIIDGLYKNFKLAIHSRNATAIQQYQNDAQEKLLPLIRKLKGADKNLCQKQYEWCYNVVTWSDSDALEGIKDLMRVASDFMKTESQELCFDILSNVAKTMKPIASDAEVFLRVKMKFEKLISLDSKKFLSIIWYIKENGKDISKALKNGDIKSYKGFLSKIKGTAFEKMVMKDPIWRRMRQKEVEKVGKQVARLGGEWQKKEVEGNVWVFFGGEGWKLGPDWGVYGINRELGIAFAGAEMEAKAARISEGVDQSIRRSFLEVSSLDYSKSAYRDPMLRSGAPSMIRIGEGPNAEIYALVPNHDTKGLIPTRRYLLNTAGSRIPKADLDKLRLNGITLTELQVGITAEELELLFDSFTKSSLKAMGF